MELSFSKLGDYVAASGTVDMEPVWMIVPSADLSAFLGKTKPHLEHR